MYKYLVLAFISFSFLGQIAQAQDRYAVFFKYKPQSSFSLERPSEFLTERALQRRVKENVSPDSTDLPVSEGYVEQVKEYATAILYQTKWLNASLVVADLEAVQNIEQLPFVDRVELVGKGYNPQPNERLRTPESESKIQKFLPLEKANARTLVAEELPSDFQNSLLGIDKMHEEGFKGEGIRIAVFDVGFPAVNTINAFSHLINNGQIIDQKDFVRPWNENVFTDYQHGTNVLSLIGAMEAEAYISGAPNAEYFLAMTEELLTEYKIEEYNWLRAAEYADSIGVDIINSSLGYFDFDDPSMNYTFEDLDGKTTVITRAANFASQKGILVVNSVGNYGPSEPSLVAPSDSPEVLAIGSVNQDLAVSNFSSRGPTSDGRIKPDLAAFGNGVSLIRNNGSIGPGSGTSFAAPQIVALAAGLWQARPDWTRSELIDNLLRSASNYDNPDNLIGYGIPDFYKALYGEILSIEEQGEELVWKVYPNPISGNSLKIHFGKNLEASFTIFDMSGKSISNLQLKRNSNKDPFEVNIEGLPSGFFIIQMEDGSDIKRQKLIRY
ncbi:T9SS type A sorting domain-containing protein [Algoriphagus kandeliae]|uniref:T9SS type A sorting domain-containing protein n=1 Tax=Algoriphagus kandeliae TaxID=2562278 RepID=A0A4Y9R046_9BACT|nr:S8 family serine peptidase [Algoriphagus kandeliae]TFV97857.1 T9SS type A sorting domain-containing protein [Algoriphagus kandeliae]